MQPSARTLTSIAAAALAFGVGIASAEPCRAARVGPGVDSLPEVWRNAVASLILATATEGQPWSCGGGMIVLALHDEGARLTIVTDDGRSIARDIATPEEVEPLGEALLARPLPPLAPAEDTPPATSAAPPRDAPNTAPRLPEPRVLIDALIAPRYAGKSNLIWGGISAGAAVPFSGWHAGAWVRYDGVSAVLSEGGNTMTEVCVGASGGRTFSLGPVDLRASVVPSVAIVTRSLVGVPDGEDETRVDGRVGLDARAVVPITGLLRAVVALDGEIAPRGFSRDMRPHHEDDRFSAFPSYTLGLGVGVELAPR
ncbi:MAG: hypothetical protein U0359_10240 [Byssovorax sp.]